jgi:hypothetical protein
VEILGSAVYFVVGEQENFYVVAASVLGILTVTMEIASHHTAHSHIGKGSQVCQSNIG